MYKCGKYAFIYFFLISKEIYCDSSTVIAATKDTNALAVTRAKPSCEDEKLISFLADIQVINPESIVEWAVDNLEPLCRKVCRSIKKIDNYLQSCNPPNEEDLYMSLIMGIKTLQEKLCTESDFIKRYCIYYPCLHELRNDFETCNGPADWNEDPDKNEMCKAYKEIVDCYYIKAAKVCGYDAAAAVKELMKDVINSVIRIKCSGINRNPYVEDPMPETYIKRSQGVTAHNTYSRVVLIISISITYMFY